MGSTMQNLIILLGLVVGGYLLPPNHSWNTFMWYCFGLAITCLLLSMLVAAADLAGDQKLHEIDARKLSFSHSRTLGTSPVITNSLLTRSPVRIRTPHQQRTPRSRQGN